MKKSHPILLRSRLAFLLFAAWVLAGAPLARAAASGNQLLLVHDEAKVVEPLVQFLKAKGGFDTLVVDQAHLPKDWSGYRAVLGYVHGRLTEPTELAIIDYTKKGGRFVALHHMISSGKAENKYYFAFLGIELDNPKESSSPVTPGGGYGWYTGGEGEPGVKVTLVQLHPTHFIVTHDVQWGAPVHYQSSDALAVARDYPAIVLPKSEAYMNHKFTDGREKTVLCGMQYTDPRTHAFFEQDRTAWFKKSGDGYIFYFQSGHFAEEYQNPNISQMILNAIIWDGR
ncbi:MAG TPA: ThuA domain-containing protein [Opitutaceae bacterium]|nr:ThuA domain-containing protein [Opitutaceae bacterium]